VILTREWPDDKIKPNIWKLKKYCFCNIFVRFPVLKYSYRRYENMADLLGETFSDDSAAVDKHDYGVGIPLQMPDLGIKGADNYDWGMKARLAKIFSPKDGNSIVFAIDHGASQGPTTGLERIDRLVPEVIDYVDVLMPRRGMLYTSISPKYGKGLILRTSSGGTIISEGSALGSIGVDIGEAVRLDALAMAVGANIGDEATREAHSIKNLHESVNAGNKVGIPTLGVVTVGREMARSVWYYLLATRSIAETGCQFIKTYYTETDFEKVTSATPVPIIIAGGKVLPEAGALELSYNAMCEGARGVDMGRNIFQAGSPRAMSYAISLVVHGGYTGKQAFEAYEQMCSELGVDLGPKKTY